VKLNAKWVALIAVFVAAIASLITRSLSPNVVPPVAFPHTYTVIPAAMDSLCASTDTMMVRLRGLDTAAVSFARANGYFNWCVPEYDDDQRFHDGNVGSADYGSVAHVLASPALSGYTKTTQFEGQWIQVGIIDVEAPVTASLMPYATLGLHDHNCIYLQHHSALFGILEGYDALIVPPDMGITCPVVPNAALSQQLDVRVDRPYSDVEADYPPTTRFVEGTGGRTLVSVKCANRWCVIGPQHFRDIPRSAHADVGALIGRAQGVVKGWFDDQVLGEPDGSAPYGIHRKIRASAIPDPGLGSLHVADFIVGVNEQKYQIVGKTYFPTEPSTDSKYVRVFGFHRDTNVVALRAEIQPTTSGKDTVWFARVTNAKANTTKENIKTFRTDHHRMTTAGEPVLASVPATMRWRWFDLDEDLWVECDIGCCLIGIR
jgi:hypothetical protein